MASIDTTRALCWGAALAWAALSVVFLAQPAALTPDISWPVDLTPADIGSFWLAGPERAPIHVALHLGALLTALVTLGAVVDVARALGARARWASALAASGMVTMAISNTRFLAMERTYARLYREAEPAARDAVAVASASLALDPYGVLEFGTFGVWLLAVTWALGPRRGAAQVALAGVGALGLFGMVFGSVAWEPALDVAPILGTPCLVLWLVLLPRSLDERGGGGHLPG